MPARKSTKAIPGPVRARPVEEQDEPYVYNAAEEAEGSIEGMISSMPANASVEVYRKDEKTSRLVWTARFLPEEFDIERVQKEYGGGTYQVRGRVNGKYVGGSQTISIADPPKSQQQTQPNAAPQTSRVDSIMEVGIMTMMQQMMQMNQMQAAAMKSIVEGVTAAKPDDSNMMAMMMQQMQMQADMFKAQIEAQAAQRGNAQQDDPFAFAMKIMELTRQREAPRSTVTELAESMAALRKLSAEFGGQEKTDPMIPLASKAMELLTVAASQPRVPQPMRQNPPRAAQPQPAPQPQGATEVLNWKTMLGAQVPEILSLAEKDRDPAVYAQLTIDNLPGIVRPVLDALVAQEDYLAQIFAEFPALKAREEWVTEYLTEIERLAKGISVEDFYDDDDVDADLLPADAPIAVVLDETGQTM